MLQYFGLSDGFWAEALLTTVHIINMLPSRPLGLKILQETWTGSKPNYDKMRIFGCEAYALIPKDDRWKLEPRSRKCVFLGYGPDGVSNLFEILGLLVLLILSDTPKGLLTLLDTPKGRIDSGLVQATI